MDSSSFSAEELKRMNDPEKVYEALSKSYEFWYYSSYSTVNKILLGKQIYIRSIDRLNDIDEKNLHKDDCNKVYCLCFCNSKTEKIPMWYLYSGITGQGAAIGITSSQMKKLIESIEFITDPNSGEKLEKGEDFDIEYGWIYYRRSDNNQTVKYRNKWYNIDDASSFERNNYFIKSYPWEYEREFRIIIHLKKEENYDALAIDISDVYDKLKVKLGPEMGRTDFENGQIENNEGYKQFMVRKILRSKLQINMDLINRNIESFVDFVGNDSMTIDEINLDEICDGIRNRRNKTSECTTNGQCKNCSGIEFDDEKIQEAV